ncbi:MAG: FGGY-family carbohydrate kinase [Bacillota bacterium]
MAILGLDVGSTGCKAKVFSEGGEVLGSAHLEYPIFENVFETHGDIIWESVCKVIKDAVVNVNVPVSSMSISSFGESLVPIDCSGNVLMNTMLYTDKRGGVQLSKLLEKIDETKIMSIAGMKPQTMYSLVKMMYIKDNYPKIYENTHKFLLVNSYITFMLTGEFIVDYSMASRTMAFDIKNKNWSFELLDAAGISDSKMPDPVPSGKIIGKICADKAQMLGLSEETVVVSGGQDQVCAALGAGVIDENVAIDGTGTVECITPIFNNPNLTSEFLNNNFTCVPYILNEKYATYAYNFTGGAILKWFKQNFACESSYQELDRLGAKLPTDLIVIPHFAGSATPDMNENARGAFLGLKFDTDNATLYRAMIEGVTFEMLYNLEILKEFGIEFDELRAVGGGAKSDYWLQIKASILGKKIVSLDVEEAGIVGAAIMAGVATGIFESYEQAVSVFVRTRKIFEPIEVDKKHYEKSFKRYKVAREAIANIFKGEI